MAMHLKGGTRNNVTTFFFLGSRRVLLERMGGNYKKREHVVHSKEEVAKLYAKLYTKFNKALRPCYSCAAGHGPMMLEPCNGNGNGILS